MESAREMILQRVRSANAMRLAIGMPNNSMSYSNCSRDYHGTGSLDPAERIELFDHRVKEYGAGVRYTVDGNIAAEVREILIARDKKNVVVPSGLPAAWMPQDFRFTFGDELSPNDLDRFDGVLTGCRVAIALTGSVILQNVAGQGPRKLSLIPDYHLCIVFTEQIVETVPEAFHRLESTATLPTTFISGPSATADIEMTRIKGVHGPRFLDVLIVGDDKQELGIEQNGTG